MSAIGVFDSGLGGLTVLKALRRTLPGEDFLYLGDTARVPYGSKSPQTVRQYAREILSFLLKQDMKAVVVACNSATAVALALLQEVSPVPVIGVIEPGARAAFQQSSNKRIAVVGTTATVNSGAYEAALKALHPEVKVFSQACPLWVPLAEEGFAGRQDIRPLLAHYLEPLMAEKPDTLVLGCTHYPLLKTDIQAVVGGSVKVVESGPAVAEALQETLGAQLSGADNPGSLRCFVTDQPPRFNEFVTRFLGEELTAEPVALETLEHLSRA